MLKRRPLRFGALVLAYRQVAYLSWCLRALAPHVDHVVVLHSETPFSAYNPKAPSEFGGPDGSRQVLDDLTERLSNLHVIDGVWEAEEPMRDAGLAELRRLARRQVAPGLEQLPGVAEVRVTGGREEDATGAKLQYIVSGYYFRFNREIILDAIQPSVEVTSFPMPDFSGDLYTTEGTYVVHKKESLKLPRISRGQKGVDERVELFQDLVRKSAELAFIEAMLHTNNSLSPRIAPNELQSIIGDHDYFCFKVQTL